MEYLNKTSLMIWRVYLKIFLKCNFANVYETIDLNINRLEIIKFNQGR